MAQIRFGIDTSCITEDEFFEILDSLNTIEEITGSTLQWGDPKDNTVYMEYSFRNEQREECAYSMMNDVHINFPFATTLETF